MMLGMTFWWKQRLSNFGYCMYFGGVGLWVICVCVCVANWLVEIWKTSSKINFGHSVTSTQCLKWTLGHSYSVLNKYDHWPANPQSLCTILNTCPTLIISVPERQYDPQC